MILAEILSIHSAEAGTDFWLRNVSKNLDMEENNHQQKTSLGGVFQVEKRWWDFHQKMREKILGDGHLFFGAEKPPHPPTPRLESQFRTAARDPGELCCVCLGCQEPGRAGISFLGAQTRWWLQICFIFTPTWRR